MPIAIAPSNTDLVIRKIGAEEKTRKHLQELGITVGSTIKLISSAGGNVIVIVKEGRLCLDRNLASKILVA
ncbi:MAG: ferrous iron transport protein A [Clostridia bacterium]|nr:ferrous iron transport protein A [Clostridia bacterium]